MSYFVSLCSTCNNEISKTGMIFDFKTEKEAKSHVNALLNGRNEFYEMFCFNVYEGDLKNSLSTGDENVYADCVLYAVTYRDDQFGFDGTNFDAESVYAKKYKINCNNNIIFDENWEELEL